MPLRPAGAAVALVPVSAPTAAAARNDQRELGEAGNAVHVRSRTALDVGGSSTATAVTTMSPGARPAVSAPVEPT